MMKLKNLPTIVRRLKVKEINGSAKDTEYKEADDAAENYLAKNKKKTALGKKRQAYNRNRWR